MFRRSYDCIPSDAVIVATLGNFDGVHRGHQQILERVISIRDAWRRTGQKAYALVISFHPHPVSVLGEKERLPFISTLWQKAHWTAEFGVDFFNLIHFTRSFANLSSEDFIHDLLIGKAHISCLVVGADACVGRGGRGDLGFIEQELRKKGALVEVHPDEIQDGLRISSGSLRKLIGEGRIDEAGRMLGRPFEMEGRVVAGDRRGRQLGFPTLNLLLREQLCPPGGVYVSEVVLPDGSRHQALTNVGVRPTFGGSEFRIETHVIDYECFELYGKRIRVAFLKKLRDEVCFADSDSLKGQLERDRSAARDYFSCL